MDPLIQGKVNAYHSEDVVQRVSDVFTRVIDPFVVLFDATAEGKSGGFCQLINATFSGHRKDDKRKDDTPNTMTVLKRCGS